MIEFSFWHTSALIALCLDGTERTIFPQLWKECSRPTTWWGAPVEASLIFRNLSQAGTAPEAVASLSSDFTRLFLQCSEMQPTQHLRDLSTTLIDRFGLRIADSLHLASALCWCQEKPFDRVFFCLDGEIANTARQVGFDVLTETSKIAE